MTEKTFDNFDKFNRGEFAARLTRVISTFYPYINGAYVLGLNASYGAGKTTFLEMWKNSLTQDGYKVIYLNTWETDFADDPIIPTANSLIEFLNQETGDKAEKAKKSLQGIIGAAALIGNSVLENATGINVHEIMQNVNEDLEAGQIEALGSKISQAFSARVSIYKKLKAALSAYVEALDKKPLVILVDELDRVRPDYAIKFLEAVKHIFSVKGVCFVLAADRRQLELSTKQIYGDIDFNNYYRRFVVREANLPELVHTNWQAYVQQLSDEYFDEKLGNGIPFIFKKDQKRMIANYAANVCSLFSFTPRQAGELFRIYSQFMAVDPKDKIYMDSWLRMAFLLIAIFIKDKEKYNLIGQGRFSPAEFEKFIAGLDFNRPSIKQEDFLYEPIAFLLTEENERYMRDALTLRFGTGKELPENAEREYMRQLGGIVSPQQWSDLPRNEAGFQTLYKRLEDWRSYLE